jgi:hypothetical protein
MPSPAVCVPYESVCLAHPSVCLAPPVGAGDGFVRVDLERARGEVRAPAAKPIEEPMRAVKCAIGAAPAGGR